VGVHEAGRGAPGRESLDPSRLKAPFDQASDAADPGRQLRLRRGALGKARKQRPDAPPLARHSVERIPPRWRDLKNSRDIGDRSAAAQSGRHGRSDDLAQWALVVLAAESHQFEPVTAERRNVAQDPFR